MLTSRHMTRVSQKADRTAILTDTTFARGVSILARLDPDLARVVETFGPPPMWQRESGFHTLLHIILEQQVSLASARAAYDRLLAVASPLTPERFLELDDAALKMAGFSRQKTSYGRGLAESIAAGRFSLSALESMDDDAARLEMIKVKGVGSWTADIYLLMALRRADIWPAGDLALAIAVQRLKRLPTRPTPKELIALSEPWRPWRAVAARILWHYYLSERALRKVAR
jgi:DNA-3-methyladenine glycosylase II